MCKSTSIFKDLQPKSYLNASGLEEMELCGIEGFLWLKKAVNYANNSTKIHILRPITDQSHLSTCQFLCITYTLFT